MDTPRGGRKTTDAGGCIIAALLEQAPRSARLYGGASDEDQAALVVDAARGLIDRSGLAGALTVNELRITNNRTGASYTAIPGDASAMGKTAWLIVLDELANWPETRKARRFWGVMTSGNRKVAACRTLVMTNAGVPEHWAYKRRETYLKSRNWRVAEVAGPLPWLTERDVEILYENAETDSEFRRLHLNEWITSENALASREDILACAILDEPQEPRYGWRYVLGLDMGTVRDRAVAAVMHLEPAGEFIDPAIGNRWRSRPGQMLVLDRVKVWTPTRNNPVSHAEVEEWVERTARRYGAIVHFDPSELRGMTERLLGRGVPCQQFTFSATSVGRLGVLLHQLLNDHQVELLNDEELIDELAHVRLRRTAPGQYRLDHDSGRHDDRAVAIALAAQLLVTQPAMPASPVVLASSSYLDHELMRVGW